MCGAVLPISMSTPPSPPLHASPSTRASTRASGKLSSRVRNGSVVAIEVPIADELQPRSRAQFQGPDCGKRSLCGTSGHQRVAYASGLRAVQRTLTDWKVTVDCFRGSAPALLRD